MKTSIISKLLFKSNYKVYEIPLHVFSLKVLVLKLLDKRQTIEQKCSLLHMKETILTKDITQEEKILIKFVFMI